MTTKELILRLKMLGFVGGIADDEDYIEVFDLSDHRIGYVSKDTMYNMRTTFSAFDRLKTTEKQQLFNVLSEYASTPIEDREDELLERIEEIKKELVNENK